MKHGKLKQNYSLFAAIKQTMEKDVDVVGKIARTIKSKIEQLDREARQYIACLVEILAFRFF